MLTTVRTVLITIITHTRTHIYPITPRLPRYGLAAKSITVYGQGQGPTSGTYDTAIELLEAFSKGDGGQNGCLAHLFTNRDFDGTLGLAYIGTVCSNTYNTGFHSVYGISTAVQQLTLT